MTQNVSDTLNLAADLIEERGWGRGPASMFGREGLCLMGAIHAATFGAFDDRYAAAMTCPAGRAVYHHLGLKCNDQDAGWEWNDDQWIYGPDRTWSLQEPNRVVEVLRAAAVIESARERETAEVSA